MSSVTVDTRYLIQNRSSAVQSIEEGLVELILNANDAYASAANAGIWRAFLVTIDIIGNQRKILITDHAIGLSPEQMKNCFAVIGTKSSDEAAHVHGIFSRGAKDVSELGKVTFNALKDGVLTTLELRRDLSYNIHSQAYLPEEHGLWFHGHPQGLRIEIDVIEIYWQSDIINLVKKIEMYFATRYLFADPAKLFQITATGAQGEPLFDKRLNYMFPPGELRTYTFEVPGYKGIYATLDLVITTERIAVGPDEKQQQFGILVCGDDAIYGVEFFRTSLRADNNFRFLHGRLHCTYIRELMLQWDNNLMHGLTDANNSKPIINPVRTNGLYIDHPFTKQLYIFPVAKIHEHLVQLSNTGVSATFSDFGAQLHQMELFGGNYISTSDDFMEYRERVTGDVIRALEDLNGPVIWTERSAPMLNLQYPVSKGTASSPDLFRIFTRLTENTIDAVPRHLQVNSEGDLVNVDQETLEEQKAYVKGKINKFDLQLKYDLETEPDRPVRHLQDRFVVIIYIMVNHPLVSPLVTISDGVVKGMHDRTAQFLTATLIGRIMGRLVTNDMLEKYYTTQEERSSAFGRLQEVQDTIADRFTNRIFHSYMKSNANFVEYVNENF
jgi:hypothetical protein